MVSICQKAVFVHVPKNAGTAIATSLNGTDRFWPMHVPWRTLKDRVGKREGFGFVRDPWHRMVSLYYFLCRSPDRHRQRVDREQLKRDGFKKWLLEGETFMSNEPVDGQIWIRQNQRYLDVGPGNTYPGIENLEHPTLGMPPMQRRPSMWWLDGLKPENIGSVETLAADLSRFRSKFEIDHRVLQKQNVTHGKPSDWRAEHDTKTIDFIARYHAMDIEKMGYTPP